MLTMATSNGAQTLGRGDRVGRLAPGYLADLIVLDLDQPHLTPLYNPVSHLIYAASGMDVIHTIVHGEVLMEDRNLTTIDLEELYQKMERISKIMAEVVGNGGRK